MPGDHCCSERYELAARERFITWLRERDSSQIGSFLDAAHSQIIEIVHHDVAKKGLSEPEVQALLVEHPDWIYKQPRSLDAHKTQAPYLVAYIVHHLLTEHLENYLGRHIPDMIDEAHAAS